MVVGPLWWLAVAPAPWKWAWALALWCFGAIAIVFAALNRRGTWGSTDRSLAAQLDLTELRCRRQQRTLRFVPLLFAAESVAALLILWHFAPRTLPVAAALLGALAIVAAAWWVAVYSRTRRRLAQVAAIRSDLAAGLPES